MTPEDAALVRAVAARARDWFARYRMKRVFLEMSREEAEALARVAKELK